MTDTEWKHLARKYKNKGLYPYLLFLLYRCCSFNKRSYTSPYNIVEQCSTKALNDWFHVMATRFKDIHP